MGQNWLMRRRRVRVCAVVLLAVTWSVITASPSQAYGGVSLVWNAPGGASSPGDPVVALTFDDGPDPTFTPKVLDILSRYGVPATFFVGREMADHPDLVRAEAAAGHAVGNHTWDHVNLITTPIDSYAHQVDDASTRIESLTGSRPICLRAPGGNVNDTVIARVAQRGMAVVGWSVDPEDWASPGTDAIVRRVLAAARAGSIIVLHDGGGDRSQTVAALPRIISGLRSQGLAPVGMCVPPAPPPPPPPPSLKTAQWFLRTTTTSGPADIEFTFGDPGDVPIVGDWNGDGVDTPGVVRGNQIFLRDTNSSGPADLAFTYGDVGDTVIVGDWDGDGIDTLGLVRGTEVFLRNRNTSGPADVVFTYGDPGDRFVFGKWQPGATADTVGVVRGAVFLLRNSNTPGPAEMGLLYGDPGDAVEIGDWDGNRVDTPAVRRGALYLVRNSNTSGPADTAFLYGDPGDVFTLVGRWSGTTLWDGPGVAR